jgi:hypothetical protein
VFRAAATVFLSLWDKAQVVLGCAIIAQQTWAPATIISQIMSALTNQAQAAWEIQLLGVCILVALPLRNQQRRFVCPLSKKNSRLTTVVKS